VVAVAVIGNSLWHNDENIMEETNKTGSPLAATSSLQSSFVHKFHAFHTRHTLAEAYSKPKEKRRRWTLRRNDANAPTGGDDDENDETKKNELFEGQCLKRQMHKPAVPYPAWDYNWDGKMTSETSLEAFRDGIASAAVAPPTEEEEEDNGSVQEKLKKQQEKDASDGIKQEKKIRTKKTRHLLLIRHGQYDMKPADEDKHVLTMLGRYQARQTGKRLAQIARGSQNFYPSQFNGPCNIKAIHVSNMIRAKQTAELIAEQLQPYTKKQDLLQKPDPLLNETLPAPMIPIRPEITGAAEEIDAHHERVEKAFQKYFYRDDLEEVDGEEEDDDEDEFEIIVGHGNMIRYFFLRAMQLPPEAWLRLCTFNCSITYLVIRPNGMVSARMMGDIGHLSYDHSTFSDHHGFKW
jgi:serine/threonine-protein phosphatase PGAM5